MRWILLGMVALFVSASPISAVEAYDCAPVAGVMTEEDGTLKKIAPPKIVMLDLLGANPMIIGNIGANSLEILGQTKLSIWYRESSIGGFLIWRYDPETKLLFVTKQLQLYSTLYTWLCAMRMAN